MIHRVRLDPNSRLAQLIRYQVNSPAIRRSDGRSAAQGERERLPMASSNPWSRK